MEFGLLALRLFFASGRKGSKQAEKGNRKAKMQAALQSKQNVRASIVFVMLACHLL
jgi:hypothetical protein